MLGIWHYGRLVDAEDRELHLPDDVRVRLWHPITASADVTLGLAPVGSSGKR